MTDALSRVETNALHTDSTNDIDFTAIAKAQHEDTDLLTLQSNAQPFELKAMLIPSSVSTVICNVSTGVPCPYVPEKFCQAVFQSLHSLSDPSIRATQCLITSCFVWPHINKDIQSGQSPVFTAWVDLEILGRGFLTTASGLLISRLSLMVTISF